jgi:hypothetical protein
MKTVEYFDPYTHILKPTTLEKINKLKIEVLNKQRKFLSDKSSKQLPFIHGSHSLLKEVKLMLEDRKSTSKSKQKSDLQMIKVLN